MRAKEDGEFRRRVASVRSFNRFYTRQLGLLEETLYGSRFSLTEVRVLFELSQRKETTAKLLCEILGLDAGYLSRILRRFEKSLLIKRKTAEADGRQHLLTLTPKGEKAFAPLDSRSNAEVGAVLKKLNGAKQRGLIEAMTVVKELIDGPEQSSNIRLRRHKAGDMGWVVRSHGLGYAAEYGYDERFEGLVAGIVARFIEHFDAQRERCWMAESGGELVGSVFLVKKSKTVAKLRLLFVEPAARGTGLGRRLVSECVKFAEQAGYKKVTLWTQSELVAARHIYKKAGFKLVSKKRQSDWGRKTVAETWELTLGATSRSV